MKEKKAKEILDELETGYNRMADKFSETRSYFWPDLAFISDYIQDGDRVLDYGCGNGRLLEVLGNKKIDYTGADVSQKLIETAESKYPEHKFIKISSQDSLPLDENSFNKIFSIAVFHHFPKKHAYKAAKELYTITKPGGMVVIIVWNLWQKQFRKYIFSRDVILGKIFQSGIYKGLGFKDIYIPFRNNNQEEYFNRHHRVMTKNEIKKIFLAAGFKCEKSAVIKEKNIIFVGRKEVGQRPVLARIGYNHAGFFRFRRFRDRNNSRPVDGPHRSAGGVEI